jgi:hypothetical protein
MILIRISPRSTSTTWLIRLGRVDDGGSPTHQLRFRR